MKWISLVAIASLAMAFSAQAQTLPAEHPMNGYFDSVDFLDFWRTDGWAFLPEQKEAMDCSPLSSIQPVNGAPELRVSDLREGKFDPAMYLVRPDQVNHISYCSENGGVLVFYSIDRVRTLYERMRINRQTLQNEKP